jgi:hypothetical protein
MNTIIQRRIKEAKLTPSERAQALAALATGEQISDVLLSLARSLHFVAANVVPGPVLSHKH